MFSSFIRRWYLKQETDPRRAFICPLAIDELPLVLELPALDEASEDQVQNFDRDAMRWNLPSIFGNGTPLCGRVPTGQHRPFPLKQLHEAAGLIRGDVGWRDFRLVMQDDLLAAFSPFMTVDGTRLDASGGVNDEITYQMTLNKPSFVWQDSKFDPVNRFGTWLQQSALGASQATQFVVKCADFDELERRIYES